MDDPLDPRMQSDRDHAIDDPVEGSDKSEPSLPVRKSDRQEISRATVDSRAPAGRLIGKGHRPKQWSAKGNAETSRQQKNDAASRAGCFGGVSRSAQSLEDRHAQAIASPEGLERFADQLVTIAQQLRGGQFLLEPSAQENVPAGHVSHTPQREPDTNQVTKKRSASRSADGETVEETRRAAFAEMARASYSKRRKRSAIFDDPDLFGEPGWDILLDLYIAHVEDKPVSVSSACIGSAAPPTTGLRWLGVLAEQDLVAREHDPRDQRRVLVRLTEKALIAMDEYFAAAARIENEIADLRL